MNDNDMWRAENFRAAVVNLLIRKNMTQRQLADAAKMKEALLSDWLRGRKEPSLHGIFKLAKALSVGIEAVMGATTEADFTLDPLQRAAQSEPPPAPAPGGKGVSPKPEQPHVFQQETPTGESEGKKRKPIAPAKDKKA